VQGGKTASGARNRAVNNVTLTVHYTSAGRAVQGSALCTGVLHTLHSANKLAALRKMSALGLDVSVLAVVPHSYSGLLLLLKSSTVPPMSVLSDQPWQHWVTLPDSL
jgi:hypothetical protein